MSNVPEYVLSPKGTKLPLLNIRGKAYLTGAFRLVWLNEEYKNFSINTEFLLITDEQTVARTTLVLYDENGKAVKSATATKRETKKDFPDHTEKAESSSLFRALAMCGMGTQFAAADLDEGARIADAPVDLPIKVKTTTPAPALTVAASVLPPVEAQAPKANSFRKPKTAATPAAPVSDAGDQWK